MVHPDYGRTLPLSMSPAEGETFRSYMNRLAAHLEVPLLTLLLRLNLLPEGRTAIPSRYGLVLPEPALGQAARMLRVPREVLGATLLSSFDGACCDLSALFDPSQPSPRISASQWIHVRGSNACPECLSESGGVWKTRWKLPWTFACRKHGRLLADFCPGCAQRIETDRPTDRAVPAFPREIPEPLLCGNIVRGDGQSPFSDIEHASKLARPCAYPLTSTKTHEADQTVLEVQERIDNAIDGKSTLIFGHQVSASDYFRDLRSLTRVALSLGGLSHLEHVPRCIRRTLNDDLHMLDHVRETYEGEHTANGNQPPGAGLSIHKGIPNGATISAAAIVLADSVLNSGSPAEAVERFTIIGDRLREKKVLHHGCSKRFGFSSRLNHMSKLYWTKYGHGKRKKFHLSPDHVPQLFWEDEYWARVRELERRTKDSRILRLTFSVWAVEVVSDLDDAAALRELGIQSSTPLREAVLRKLRILRERRRVAGWIDATICERLGVLSSSEGPTDYGSRRRALGELRDVDRDLWKTWCEASNVTPGWVSVKSGHAATWLWCELTLGDYLLSPNFQDKNTAYQRMRYQKFLTDDLPLLKDYLLEFGKTLI